MKILLFGSTGMLGNYVETYFKKCGYTVVDIDRYKLTLNSLTKNKLLSFLYDSSYDEERDVIINCAGVIKQRNSDTREMIEINSLFPHILADSLKGKVIHVTTDCVFSGLSRRILDEGRDHDPRDEYGKSKFLVEPNNICVIRTSIIGEEKYNKHSLIEWVKRASHLNKGKIDGYVNHHWNGITCLQLAKTIEYIVSKQKYWMGVRHIFTSRHPEIPSKYVLVKMICKYLIKNIDVEVNPVVAPTSVYRILSTKYEDLLNELNIPTMEDQMMELAEFNILK